MNPEDICQRIKKALPSAEVSAKDLTGGGDHWQVRVRAIEFKDKSLVEQHQMIYQALGEWMYREIHALSLDTSTQ